MKARALGGVEFVDVVRGDEIDLRPLGEGARFIEDEPAAFHAGAQCVRHSRSLALDPPASSRRKSFDHVDAAVLVQRIGPDLDRARERGEVLLRVSVTLPPWNHDGATMAAHIFRDLLLSMGASGILLARDRREDGAPHWHGVVTVPEGGTGQAYVTGLLAPGRMPPTQPPTASTS